MVEDEIKLTESITPEVETKPEIKIEGYEKDKYSNELAAVLNKEIDYINSVYNNKIQEIKSLEMDMNRLRNEIREMKTNLEKKKLAKSVLLNEPIIRPPKVIKPKEEKPITYPKISYSDWKKKKKEKDKPKESILEYDYDLNKQGENPLNEKEVE